MHAQRVLFDAPTAKPSLTWLHLSCMYPSSFTDDENRCRLTRVIGVPNSDYINASFINVSCDYPNTHTLFSLFSFSNQPSTSLLLIVIQTHSLQRSITLGVCTEARLHSYTGSSPWHSQWLLADGLGVQVCQHCDVDQGDGGKSGKVLPLLARWDGHVRPNEGGPCQWEWVLRIHPARVQVDRH